MKPVLSFSDVLKGYVKRSAYSAGQLARLSGVPKPTILSWLDGRVKHPRAYDDLIKLTRAINLSSTETAVLLESAGHTAVADTIRTISAQAASEGESERSVPFQAIPALPFFVGREEVIKQVEIALMNPDGPRMCTLYGMGGIGKTSLAAHVAYHLRQYFPDGVLWAHAGHTNVMTVLQAFAQAYQVDVTTYGDVNGRSQIVRQLLADKQALIILDDVWNSADAKYLIPPSTGKCAVLMTTRKHNLLLADIGERIGLSLFDNDHPDSIALFRQLLGDEFVQQYYRALVKIADLVGHLPLAVSIVAHHLAYEPDWTVSDFLDMLQQRQDMLEELEYDVQSVQLSFHIGYDGLPEEMRRFFMKLAVRAEQSFKPETAAYLTQLPLHTTRRYLRHLYGLSLVLIKPGKKLNQQRHYYLHPLMREFGRKEAELYGIKSETIPQISQYNVRH